jgi:lipopolysaccharide export system protein LptC
VAFEGNVEARGRLQGGDTEVRVTTAQLQYDLAAQTISSDSDVALAWGNGVTSRSNAVRVNIKEGKAALGKGTLQYGRGTPLP